MVGKKRVDNPGENVEELQTSLQNVTQEQKRTPRELLPEDNNERV